MAATLLLSATRLMLKRFRPTEDLRDWYVRKVRGSFAHLLGLEVEITEMP